MLLALGALGLIITWQFLPKSTNQAQSSAQEPVTNSSTNSDQPQSNPSNVQAASDEQQVEDAARGYCTKQLDANGQPYTFVLGKIGPSSKNMLFSADKLFASINVHCAPLDEPYGGTGYILKKMDNTWTVITVGSQENPEAVKTYGIPNDFN